MNEPEIVVETKSNKVKIVLSILVSTIFIATISTLLVGHLKFDWFKFDEYKIDAKINRSIYQANYFSEKKTINTILNYEDGHHEEKEYTVDNNFVVFVTDKKDNINTGALVLLSAIAHAEGQTKEINHLDLSNEEQRKDFEAFPDGAKYPMAEFKFTDDGDIKEINLPSNMDEYNAQSLLEVIKKIIPKLTRSKKEDMSNGLEITSKKTNNKRTIVQSEAPKQFQDFEGSRYTKVVKTEIEDDQITNVESNDSLYMESKREGDEIIYGPKDFTYNSKSEIISSEVKYNEKENVEIVNNLIGKFNLIDSETLLKRIAESKEPKNYEKVIDHQKKYKNATDYKDKKIVMGHYGPTSKTYEVATFKVLGQSVTVKYEVGMKNNKAYNKVVIISKFGTFEFGNKDSTGPITKTFEYSQMVFKFIPPPFPLIAIGVYIKGVLEVAFGVKSGSGYDAKYFARIEGSLILGAEIKIGWDFIASLTAFAEGTILSASAETTIYKGVISKTPGFRLSIGKLVVGIRACLFWFIKTTLWTTVLFKGWTIN